MKVLVTGSEGYIGSRLTQVLLEEGFDITGLDTGYYSEGKLYDSRPKHYDLVVADIRNIDHGMLKGYEAVIHLAELSNDPLGQIDQQLTFDINHNGTVKLANLAKQAGVSRFVYFSSCSVYGASDNISDENTSPNPLTAYAKSKILNEQALRQLANDGFSPTILRNATVFGASPRMRFDLVVNDLAASAFVNKLIKMSSDGTPWRPLVHVSDVSRAVVFTLRGERKNIHNILFNVGSNENNYQVKELAEIVASVFPGCGTQFGDSTGDKRNYRVNFDRIGKILPGFKCEWNVKRGAAELRDIFEQIDFNREMYQSRFYTRLKQIDYLKNSNLIDGRLYWVKL